MHDKGRKDDKGGASEGKENEGQGGDDGKPECSDAETKAGKYFWELKKGDDGKDGRKHIQNTYEIRTRVIFEEA